MAKMCKSGPPGEKTSKNFEPKSALDGGHSGYSKIEKVIKKSSDLLKKKWKLDFGDRLWSGLQSITFAKTIWFLYK